MNTARSTSKHCRRQCLMVLLLLVSACAPSPDDLVAQLDTRDPRQLTHISDRLLQHRSDVVPALRRGLADDNWRIRYMSAQLLGTLRARVAVADLIVALADSNVGVVERSATALGLIADTMAVAPLVETLSHPSIDVAIAAAAALEKVGDGAAMSGLLAYAEDSSPRLRVQVLQAFGTCVDTTRPELAQQVYERLTAVLDQGIPSMQVAAIAGLRGFDYRGQADWLMAAVDDESPDVTYVAVQALGEIDRVSHPAWQGVAVDEERLVATLLRAARTTPVQAIRDKALRSLGQLQAIAAVPYLDSLKATGSRADRRAAGRALSAIAGEGW